jgi:dolichol-phosphate mannosyltransferase/undecaprenyl-phosphate 4-deoxy-4-formamido-L-arabinose transferase
MVSPTFGDDLDISVVIPVYRSGECLPELLRQLCGELDGMRRSYEIILVDDGSPDGTWQVIRELAEGYRCVRAVQLMRNRGQVFATLCGLSHARGKIVVTMDDDLQHPPGEIPKLLAALEGNRELDCVFGCFPEKRHVAYRNFASRIMARVIQKAFHLPRNFRSSSLRAMRRTLVGAILGHRTANPSLAVLIFNSTSHVGSIALEHAPRYAGKSNYTLGKQIRLALDGICNVSVFPLRAISVAGMVVCGMSAVLIGIVLYKYLSGAIGVPGWTTVVVLLSFFDGMILLSLGIFGEYLVRVLREVRGTPPYVERDRAGCWWDADDNKEEIKK